MIVNVIGKRRIYKKDVNHRVIRDGMVIHSTCSEKGVTGTSVKSFYVKSEVCDPRDIIIGKQYHIEEAYIRGGLYVVKCERKEDAE